MAVNLAGVVRDYWSSAPIAGAQVTTLGLKPLLVGTSDKSGRFALSGRARVTSALLAIKGPAGYVETIMPVTLADTPMVIDTWAVSASDLARQSASLGKVPVPNTTVVIVDLVDAAGQPLERVPLTDVSLLGSDGGPLGDGPYCFGPGGDLQGQSDLSTSCAFDGRARSGVSRGTRREPHPPGDSRRCRRPRRAVGASGASPNGRHAAGGEDGERHLRASDPDPFQAVDSSRRGRTPLAVEPHLPRPATDTRPDVVRSASGNRLRGSDVAGSGSILGNAVLRLEDPTLLTGEGKYVDDLVETGMLYVALVRSHVAHGTINSVDISDASSMPGVVAVFHAGNDLGMPAMQGFAMLPPDYNRPIFASERVRFVGDVIAAVVAESQAQANDAAEQVLTDIEPLPVVLSAADGLAPDAPLLFPETGSNICFATEFGKDGGDPVRGRRRGRRGHDGQPASGGRADGEQRRRRRSGGRRPHDVGVAPGAALDPWRVRPDARPRPCSAANRLPVGRWRVRPEGRQLRRAPDRRQGRDDPRQAGEVGREPLRGHGVAWCTAATTS